MPAPGGSELPCGRRATLLGLAAGVAVLAADALYLQTPAAVAIDGMAGPRYLPADVQQAVDQAIIKNVPKGKVSHLCKQFCFLPNSSTGTGTETQWPL
jgi:hypothetical protein